jgi:hypothetical protein
LSFKDREALLNEDVAMQDLYEDIEDPTFETLPPGQEALFLSHAGGPEEVLDDLMGQFRSKNS